MRIIESYAKESDCYRAGKRIAVKGLMLHSVGCPQPDASVFARNWNKRGVGACAHAVLDASGAVYQVLPWDWRGWHGASGAKGCVNDTHIGVEMTEPDTIEYTGGATWREKGDGTKTKSHVMATYRTAVELFAALCKVYDLNPLADGVVISHHEGYVRGIASGHADVEHLWSRFGLTMDQFRRDVKAAMEAEGKPKVPDPINATVKPNTGADYQRLTFEDAGNGRYRIKDKANGYYLTASGKTPNANVDFRPEDGGNGQLWTIEKKTYGHADYTMFGSVLAAGQYLSVENNGMGGKTNLKLYTDLHNQQQKFFVREESDGRKLAIHVFSGMCVSAKG